MKCNTQPHRPPLRGPSANPNVLHGADLKRVQSRRFQQNEPRRWSFFFARRDAVSVAAVLALCVALSACGGNAGGGGGNPSGAVASFTPQNLSFTAQLVGTPSGPETTILTNTGTIALQISTIQLEGANASDFSETDDCGTSLNVQASCEINVVFTPATAGQGVGAISVSDNANGSPQSVGLAGEGAGAGQDCSDSGPPQMQSQADVTSQLSYANTAAGVSVTQLTNNGCNHFYYFDVPAFSAVTDQIFYLDFVTGQGNNVLTADPGTQPLPGGDVALLSPSGSGTQTYVSPDGTFVHYDKETGNPGSLVPNIFGGFLKANSSYAEFQITNLNLLPQPPLGVWEISTAGSDGAGGQYVGFSPNASLYEVHVAASGTLTPGLNAPPLTYTLNDTEYSAASTFHRIRLNPKYPNIVMYKRNVCTSVNQQTGQCQSSYVSPNLWLVDLNACMNNTCPAANILNVVQDLPGLPAGLIPKAGHPIWSPDGLDIAFSESDLADFWIARNVITVTNSVATINPNFTIQQLGPYPPNSTSSAMTADYCVFPVDWPTSTILACVAGPASPVSPKTFYLMSSDGIGTTKLLAASDAVVQTINGTPMPQFAQDHQHILFNSDRTCIDNGETCLVQVYMISGFTYSVP